MENESEYPDNRWLILGVMSLSLIIVMLNNVTLNVALPELSKDLKAGNSELQWIMDSYALVFGGTLLLMGALGDRFGRKGALQIGLIIVASASAWTALYAETSNQVIFARAAMGLGAALVMPSTLSVVLVVFPPEERGKAIGIWAAMAGIGAPIGLLVGGWAVENFDWQMVFLINVPVIIIALVAGALIIPRSKDSTGKPLDLVGSALSVVALGSLLYGIIEGPSLGWDDQNVIVAFVAFLLSGAMFVRSQLRSEHPLLPLEFFSQRQFTIGLMAIALAMFVMFSFMFMQMLHFQLVRGLSPLEAAIRFFPLPLGLMPAAANSDRLVGKLGRKKVVTLGLSLVAAGLLLFTLVTTETAYVQIALTFVLLGLGMGLTMAPSTTAIMEAIPESKAGVGSATNDASREVGGALGIAIGGSVLNQIYQKSLVIPESFSHIKDVLSSSFPAAMRVGAETGGPEGAALIASAQEAFVSGMVGSCYVAAAVAAIAAIIVWTKMPDEAATNSTSEE
ncbi:MAG: DHA2 family efflux MFS transporter permease subunit [Euryarchaeota archaeon]|jgi:EmrB/QacA subfamily drug resistance transporter|nr:DHA2 family efflux MFS transporter permease subunit [Euryarchaeota archaeon]MBT5594663.1 DHA2 family efflux MFS transporter permease subunit [Euryarchaeota archaeon]MBT5844213.1 DHA2 family efflux MFS transporter permease subunit [Euryarchaeota archaeon]MBT6640783.1 DHA2 family efflux MFS transporter permease subunit [Euryarchaeota archaeon]MBT6845428.1 DHA2 family efflux MFS transporter permease subunit [Euryarchaeota archaeon]